MIDFLSASSVPSGASVRVTGKFADAIRKAVATFKPTRVLEVGTYMGVGTTRILLDALKATGQAFEFVTMEVNPLHAANARIRLEGEPVTLLNLLSVPRSMLPTGPEVEMILKAHAGRGLYVDHEDGDRVSRYLAEVGFDVPDDGIGQVMRRWYGEVHLVLLDSAGHVGAADFDHLMSYVRYPVIFCLGDTRHVKNYAVLRAMKADERFEVLEEGEEKFGYAVVRFVPRVQLIVFPQEAIAPEVGL